jgi:hypothetical protein
LEELFVHINKKTFPGKKYLGVILAVIIIFIFAASVYGFEENDDLDSATESRGPIETIIRLDEIITRFYKTFEEDGDVEHDHEFEDEGSITIFLAEGRGLAGGRQYAVIKVSLFRRVFNSVSRYAASTARDANTDQHMKIGSSYSVGDGYKASVGSMPKPNETGIINQAVSTRRDEGGSYYKASTNVKTSEGFTVFDTSTTNSSTNISVEGYSEITESITIDRGGQKTGSWDF